jgi:alkylation response protein AidB-like acyl-CoA dehydrogenase
MDFNDTPEEAEFRAEVRAWLAKNAPVGWRERMAAGHVQEVCKEWQRTKYDAGWACLNWPKEYGGQGLSPIKSVIWSQEESKVAPPSAAMLVVGLAMAPRSRRRRTCRRWPAPTSSGASCSPSRPAARTLRRCAPAP